MSAWAGVAGVVAVAAWLALAPPWRDGVPGLLRIGAALLDEYETMLRALYDPRTGKPVIGKITRPVMDDPLNCPGNQSDIVAEFEGLPVSLGHPVLGSIGPAPYRRTGAHTGGAGALYIHEGDVAIGDYGTCSAFDIVATVGKILDPTFVAPSGEPFSVPLASPKAA